MSKILKIFLSISLLGFFLIPGEASACSSHTTEVVKKEKSCCDHLDHQSKQTCKKECCTDKEGGDTDCSGNCGHKTCHNSSPTFWMHEVKFSQNALLFGNKKSFPSYKQPFYSSGSHSIWQPPKIA
jgi:hypothetical protein